MTIYPVPWRVHAYTFIVKKWDVCDAEGTCVASTTNKELAHLIADAVNAYRVSR